MLPVILVLILAGIAQVQSCPVDSGALMRLWCTVDRETYDYAQQTNSKSHPVGLADGLEHYQTSESHSLHPYSGELVAADRFVRFHSADWERLTSGPGPDSVSSGNSNSASQLDESQEPFETTHDLETMASQVSVPSPPLQIQELIVSGPSSNRVDLVFFSDGYVPEERKKFFEDATRLALDISGNQTFNTVKPLLNFWAAFSPSNESGIGVGGKPKDTPFGLYRDGTELRGVYYSKPEVAKAACSSMGDQCDYPILLGNDPFYGGLGGEYTVVTSSLANGALVLRHELGHSIIDVGEEYDGGYAYFGVNAAHDLTIPLPWSHWLTNPLPSARVERSIMPMQAYPWTLLNTSTSWSINFTSSGAYARHVMRFSLSGLPEKTDLRVEFDRVDLGWVPQEDIGLDRWHYEVYRDAALSGGQHEVKFTLVNRDREGTAQLCSVEVLEFGDESEFIATPGYYGIFPTFSETNETSYRPTNEDCLMRAVTSPNFCKVCIEGLWLSLLSRVNFIDDVHEGCQWHSTESPNSKGHWKRTLEIHLVPLAQFRDDRDAASIKAAESYTITWSKGGKALEMFTNKTRLELDDETAVGTYTIDVKYATDEVRVDKDGLLISGGDYTVAKRCGA